MKEVLELSEPDGIEGAPHPRETVALFGHEDAERAFLDAFAAGALHHAWLIAGPEGIGKATLAWRAARFLLAGPQAAAGPSLFAEAPPAPPATLDIGADHPVARRVAALSEPRLFLLRRGPNQKGDGLSELIRVDEIRRLADFLHLTAADGGRRAVILDAADEMNAAAANALLKFLEEPPKDVTFLIVSHRPSSLLPTIRSRCRMLRLSPLSGPPFSAALAAAGFDPGAGASALAELSAGSPGQSIRLILAEGAETYGRIVGLFAGPGFRDHAQAIAFAERAGRKGADAATDAAFLLAETFLARLARRGAAGALPEAAPGEAAVLARLSPGPAAAREWAGVLEAVAARNRHGRAVNLDPVTLLLDMVLKISETAGRLAPG
ncbi:MAG: DNA polymerase III subunit delta' [Paracoccaceae bacterium]